MSQIKSYLSPSVHPMQRKRGSQIIKECKSEMKKLELKRRGTPIPMAKKNIGNEFSSEFLLHSRPPSCMSIKSLSFESEENYNLSTGKTTPIRSYKQRKIYVKPSNHKDASDMSKMAGDGEFKLQPIVTKPAFVYHRKNATSVPKSPRQKDFKGLPPIPCNSSRRNSESSNSSENLYQIKYNLDVSGLKKEENATAQTFLDELPSSLSCTSNESAYQSDDALHLEKDSNEEVLKKLAEYIPLLEKTIRLGRRANEKETAPVIQELYDYLDEHNFFTVSHCYRTEICRLLFKLLDLHVPMQSFNIIKLLLKMKLRGKNLSRILKFSWKLMDEKDCRMTCDNTLFEILNETLREITVGGNSDAVLFGIKAAKSIFFNDDVGNHLVKNCLTILIQKIRELNCMVLEEKETLPNSYNEIFTTVLSIFYNRVDDFDTWEILVNDRVLSTVLQGVECFSHDYEAVKISSSLLSKIADENGGCLALSCCPEKHLVTLLCLLEQHRYKIDTVLQISFVIGKLVSEAEDVAIAFVSSPNFSSTTVVLSEYVNEHFQGNESSYLKKDNSSHGDQNCHSDVLEVILKILCIWANVCLHQSAGFILANNCSVLLHLLAVLDLYTDGQKEHSIPKSALCLFLVAIGNISYYLDSDSEMATKAAERILPLLEEDLPMEVRMESACIVRNLTRSAKVRLYIQEHSLFRAFIHLMDEGEKELVVGVYTILLNLLQDETSRMTFYSEQGITKVLHQLHLCLDRDWNTSALLCHLLWNFCGGETQEVMILTDMETQHLIKYLTYAIDKPSKMNSDREDWKNNFLPTAKRLLELLHTKRLKQS